MKSAFIPRLVNHPFGDPGLFVALRYGGRAMLFDLGRIDRTPAAELLKITHVFVSHTHMDHFIGFDHLLRIFLARDLQLELCGPPGIIQNVSGKLAGYTWNLVDSYPFVLTVHEVGFDTVTTVRFPARTAFAVEAVGERPFDGIVHESDDCMVTTTHLDHRIPCLGYALTEKTRLNIRTDALEALGIPPGRWLNELKHAIRSGAPPDTPLLVRWQENGTAREAAYAIGELRDRLVVETRGQKIGYVVDTLFSRANMERVAALVHRADVFYCESLFLDADRDQATKRYHLTARQAATLARAASVARLETFHFSPRYERDPVPLRAEAQAVFRGEIPPDQPQ